MFADLEGASRLHEPAPPAAGEYVALAGCVCRDRRCCCPAYHSPIGDLERWNTFGPAVALALAALFAGARDGRQRR